LYLDNQLLIVFPLLIAFAFIAVINFKMIYFMLIAFLPLSTNVYVTESLGLYIPSEPLMALILLLLIVHAFLKRNELNFEFIKHPIILLLLLGLVWTGVNVLYSETPIMSLKFFVVKVWFVFAFTIATSLFIKTQKDFKILFWLLFSTLMFTVIHTIYKHYMLDFSFLLVNRSMQPFYFNHIDYAVLIALFFPFCIYMRSLYKKGSVIRLLLNISMLIFVIAIYFSYTRAAIVCLLLLPIIYFIYYKNLTNYVLTIGGTVAIVALLFLTTSNNYLEYAPEYKKTVYHGHWQRHFLSDISFMERIYRWVAAFRMVKDKPIVGFGSAGFYHHYKKYTVTSFKTYVSRNEEKSTVHNYFLLVLVEQGIIGFLLFTIMVFLVLIKAQNLNYKAMSKADRNFLMATYISFVIILLNNLIGDLIEVDKIGGMFYFEIAIIVLFDIKYNAKQKELTFSESKT